MLSEYLQTFKVGGPLYEVAVPLQHVSVFHRQLRVLFVGPVQL